VENPVLINFTYQTQQTQHATLVPSIFLIPQDGIIKTIYNNYYYINILL